MSAFSRTLRRCFVMGICALLLAGAIGSSSMPARADATKKTLQSVVAMLKKANYKFTVEDDVCLLFFEEKGIGKFPLIIAVDDDVIMLSTQVARAEKITRSPELTAGLLQANWTYSLLKIVFDPKGNLVFRYAIIEKMVDADDLKELIKTFVENTANMYNNAPFIKK